MKLNRLFLFAAALSSAFCARAQTESVASILTNADTRVIPERRTSIIFIQCHGLGCGDLSCYGQTNFQTPNLDRLAAEGVRFTNFRPDGTNFSGALGALLSGKKSGGDDSGETVATRLQNVGYHTALIGEWGFGGKPWLLGFEEFAGFLGENEGRNYFAESLYHYAPRSLITESNTFADFNGREEIYENTAGKKGRYLPELLVGAMCNYVRIHQPDQFNRYQPFFLLVNLPAPRSATAGADDFPVPTDAPYSDEPWPQAAKNRAALLTRLDGGIGRLFDQFKTLGLSNNIAIFFSSSAAPEKFADKKLDSIFNVGTNGNLPMIVWWPQGAGKKHETNFKMTSADFAATAMDIGYARPAKDLDGITILPVLEGKEGPQVDAPVRRDF